MARPPQRSSSRCGARCFLSSSRRVPFSLSLFLFPSASREKKKRAHCSGRRPLRFVFCFVPKTKAPPSVSRSAAFLRLKHLSLLLFKKKKERKISSHRLLFLTHRHLQRQHYKNRHTTGDKKNARVPPSYVTRAFARCDDSNTTTLPLRLYNTTTTRVPSGDTTPHRYVITE